jgi:hypothetical protein
MVVWKEHTTNLKPGDVRRMVDLAYEFFPECKCRMQMRRVSEHFHFHVIV